MEPRFKVSYMELNYENIGIGTIEQPLIPKYLQYQFLKVIWVHHYLPIHLSATSINPVGHRQRKLPKVFTQI